MYSYIEGWHVNKIDTSTNISKYRSNVKLYWGFKIWIWNTEVIINASQRCTPHRKLIQIQISKKTRGQPDRRTDGQTDGRTGMLYCHSGDLTVCSATACAACNYGLRKWSPKIDAGDQTERHRYVHKDRDIITTGTHWSPSNHRVEKI